MRCYRCGALMGADRDTCPDCGFCLHSPVEIRMWEEMTNIRVYDGSGDILWSGDGAATVYIDAPERKDIRICWGSSIAFEMTIRVKNGEAYRFERKRSKMAKAKEAASIVKTRTITKRQRKKDS